MKFSVFAVALLWIAAVAQAQTPAPVTVQDAWVRATVPAQKTTGAFLQLTASAGARLVAARSPAAGIVEIHQMTLVDNVMKMHAVPGVDLPAGKVVEFKPGGYHLMLINLKNPVRAGENIALTLVFEGRDRKRYSVDVMAAARPLNTPGSPAAPASPTAPASPAAHRKAH